MRGDGFTARKALLVLAGFWTFGGVLVVASLFGSVDPDNFRRAPTCSASQMFASAYCRVTVDATVTAVTREAIVMDVGGRRVTADMKFHGPLPDAAAGLPVRLTMYRGVPVHIEGGNLNLDTLATPADDANDLRLAGLVILIGGTVVVGANALRQSTRRAETR